MNMIKSVIRQATRVRTGPRHATFGQNPDTLANQARVRVVLLLLVAGLLALAWRLST